MSDQVVERPGALPSAHGLMSRLACAKAEASGLDADALLKKAGLTRHQIDDQGARVSVRHQIDFLNLVADALNDDLLGFHLAQPPDLRKIGLLYYVAASSGTWSEALLRAARYSIIVNEAVALQYSDAAVRMSLRYVGVSRHLDRHQAEFFAATLVRVARKLTGRRLSPVRVRMVHRRDVVSPELAEFFGDQVAFGADADDIEFGATTRQLPVVSADPYLHKLLIGYCEEALSRRPIHATTFRSIVENAVVPLLPHGKAHAAEVASRLGVSRRNLARRLETEGTTFSNVLENLKSQLAQRYLADKSLSISQAAWLLGYQETSAFTHAFKRWTGTTPREARSLA